MYLLKKSKLHMSIFYISFLRIYYILQIIEFSPRFVEAIDETYGMALLLHMLTSTVTLTLLSYEATKVSRTVILKYLNK